MLELSNGIVIFNGNIIDDPEELYYSIKDLAEQSDFKLIEVK